MPICNDSNHDVGDGYTLFDDHNEAHPINKPIKAHHFQKIYGNKANDEPLEVHK